MVPPKVPFASNCAVGEIVIESVPVRVIWLFTAVVKLVWFAAVVA